MDPGEVEIKRQREQLVKAFTDLAAATGRLAEASANNAAFAKKQIEVMNKQIEMANTVVESLMLPKDGMRDVIDELIAEVAGLRDDIRVLAKAGGLTSAISALLGGRKR
jgi:hypothetical protein